ncbi:MAG: hypothetical protein J7L72_00720 [Candidatus Aminicenantes bacterium]|nr:hypothetical protein [Candidatus Aminicenantes bacterium]
MDELEIKIVLSYKIPEKGLTLNGILRDLQEDQNELMKNIIKMILNALEAAVGQAIHLSFFLSIFRCFILALAKDGGLIALHHG